MPKAKSIHSAIPVKPEGFKFLGTKNGELSSTILDEFFAKINKENPAAIKELDEKYAATIEQVKKDISELSAKFEKMEAAFNELNSVVPVEEIAAEPAEPVKSKKKSKKASE